MDDEKRGKLFSLVMRERLSVREAADALGVSHMSAYRALSEMKFGGRVE